MADCRCVIRHPVTAEQREDVVEALGYPRRVGDMTGILLALAQLAGPLPRTRRPRHGRRPMRPRPLADQPRPEP